MALACPCGTCGITAACSECVPVKVRLRVGVGVGVWIQVRVRVCAVDLHVVDLVPVLYARLGARVHLGRVG
eukprot:scaffold82442_cov33-Phaeocystis_antarctica.AAC.1